MSISQLQKLVEPYSNQYKFTVKILKPENLTIKYLYTLSGVLGIRLDVCIGLLFSVYRHNKPDWFYYSKPPNETYVKTNIKMRRYLRRNKMVMKDVYLQRNLPLQHYHVRLSIPALALTHYLGFSGNNDLSRAFLWPTRMDLLKIIRLSTLTDSEFSETLNRVLGNIGNSKGYNYIRADKVDGVVPVPRFKNDDLIEAAKHLKPNKNADNFTQKGKITHEEWHKIVMGVIDNIRD
jgi:hypothetical protein